MNMIETLRMGYVKYHKGCQYKKGGQIQLRENLDRTANHEWDLYCIGCGRFISEEDMIIEHISGDMPLSKRSLSGGS